MALCTFADEQQIIIIIIIIIRRRRRRNIVSPQYGTFVKVTFLFVTAVQMLCKSVLYSACIDRACLYIETDMGLAVLNA